jgi:glycosyltransferase involved in cell wall biosynthesis
MRIVIDLQSCQSGSRFGGIGRYSTELAKAMARRAGKHDLWLLLSGLLPNTEADIRYEFSNLLPQDRIRVFDAPRKIAELTSNNAKVQAAELIREEFLGALKPDIVHVTSLFEGLQEDVITSVGKVFPGERTAVTLYDLIPFVQQDRYLQNKAALQHYMRKIESLKKAGLLLAISDFSRQQAIDVLGIGANNIVNISSAADTRFRPVSIDEKTRGELRAKYQISKKFAMYTGSFDQRKNHANLIKAFALLPKTLRHHYQLVIVGKGWDAIYRQLMEVARAEGLSKEDVVFAGHVDDDELLLLFNSCELFVFPSLAEGFGLPVLEAMSCGTPTICSNCTSLPEVIGWEEAQFDPQQPASIAQSIERSLIDSQFRKTLIERGLRQSKNFSWDLSAQKAFEGFEHLNERLLQRGDVFLGGTDDDSKSSLDLSQSAPADVVQQLTDLKGIGLLSDAELQEMAACIGLNRHHVEALSSIAANEYSNLNVGWVTTWNTRCGIASYSRFLVSHFPAKTAIFAAESSWTTGNDSRNVTRCWKSGGQDNLAKLTSEVIRASIEVLIVQFNYSFYEFESFSTFLNNIADLGIRIFVIFHSTSDPSESKALSSLVSPLSRCHGLITHSIGDVNRLRNLGLTSNAVFLPQGLWVAGPLPVELPFLKGKTVLATYGFALPGKGLKEVLEAFSMLELERPGTYHLLLVNAEYPEPQSAKLIAEIRLRMGQLALTGKVTLVTEYLREDVSLGYLRLADVIIYAYQNTGESSSAAVRMGISAGRAVAVTPLQVFDDVAGAVFRLPGRDPKSISIGIKEIVNKLEVKDPLAQRIAFSAGLWRSSHDYAGISRHLYWLAAKPSYVETDYYTPPAFDLTDASDPLILLASDSAFKTIAGGKDEKGIRSMGRPGNLMHGPFITVGPGTYKAIIRGSIGPNGCDQASADIAINSGARVLSACEISASVMSECLAELSFEVPDSGCTDFEVRVVVGDKSDISISAVELYPVTS